MPKKKIKIIQFQAVTLSAEGHPDIIYGLDEQGRLYVSDLEYEKDEQGIVIGDHPTIVGWVLVEVQDGERIPK